MPHLLSRFRRPFRRPQGQERVGMQAAEGIAPQPIIPEGASRLGVLAPGGQYPKGTVFGPNGEVIKVGPRSRRR